jgi:carbonic anhydrase
VALLPSLRVRLARQIMIVGANNCGASAAMNDHVQLGHSVTSRPKPRVAIEITRDDL